MRTGIKVKQLIEYPTSDGSIIYIEVEYLESEDSRQPASRVGDFIVTKAEQTLEASLSIIKPASEAILTQVNSLSQTPDEIQVEFGIALGGEIGARIVNLNGEANYKITLSWKKQ